MPVYHITHIRRHAIRDDATPLVAKNITIIAHFEYVINIAYYNIFIYFTTYYC